MSGTVIPNPKEKMAMTLRSLAILLALLLMQAPLEAQEPFRAQELPGEVHEDILAFVNDAGTLRFQGDGVIPRDQSIQGNVALVGGFLRVAGEVLGDVVVLNGDLVLEERARIEGDVLIVGGDLTGGTPAQVEGMMSIYRGSFPVVIRDGVVLSRPERRQERPGIYLAGSRITIRSGSGYNRVEGLPVLVGPLFRTNGPNPLQFDALAVFRTESSLSVDDLGYWIRLDQTFGQGPRWTLGGTAFSEVVPVESRGVSDLESSLTTFIFHRDNRDHLKKEGWSAYLGTQARELPLRFRLTYRFEDHFSVAAGSPWTLFRNDEPWRPIPLVAEGELGTLEAELEVDRRNDPEDPSDGWYLNASLVRGLHGDLAIPAFSTDGGLTTLDPTPVSTGFSAGTVDLRRYARVDPDSDLRFRLLLGGSLEAEPLPPQFQRALGGEGTLPGYRRFSLDCGARSLPVQVDDQGGPRTTFPRYGCDRTALFQMEFREEIHWELDLTPDDEDDWEEWHWYPRVDLTAAWVAFLDAGRGWSYAPDGVDTDTRADLGLGFFIGDLGFYWAFPLNGDHRRPNFFVRLQHRF